MSRLIDPLLGDILDRLTILALKILFGRHVGKDVTHFDKEQTALLSKVRARDHSGPWFHLLLELAAVNAALWHAEDDLRVLRNTPEGNRAQWTGTVGNTWVMDVANVALNIQALNDKRADLIAMINKEAGEGTAAEKL